MPTYLYETLPQAAGEPSQQFELRQGFGDEPLTVHPETGAPVRRVISGGLGLMSKGAAESLPAPGPGCGPGSCGCGRF
jgi:predicted nucleic acid-binding Zn ribbon protein